MFKRTQKLLALALAIALCLTIAIPAFADGDPVIGGTFDEPVEAAITKILTVPEGTDYPELTFQFTVTPVSVDGDTAAEALATMPVIGTSGVVEVVFNDTDETPDETVDHLSSYYLESESLFEDLLGTPWPHAGLYIYDIEEVPDTNTLAVAGDGITEGMTYSDGSYSLHVYVEYDANEDGFYVYAIAAFVVEPDNPGQNAGDKVDPTPGGDGGVTYDYSQLVFNNTYYKINNDTDPDPDISTLAISKTVDGNFANQTTLYFQFDITAYMPAISNVPTEFHAYVQNADDTFVSAADLTDAALNNVTGATVSDDNGRGMITITPATEFTVYLKHGQRVSFADAPVGAYYDITEDPTPDYIPSYEITSNSVQTSAGAELVGVSITTVDNLVGEQLNLAAFTNTRETLPITGVNISDLPFIGMIALAVASLVAYIAISRKRKHNHN